ncbi:MAG: TonB-dependent receptor plug domain-containing protein [Luteitalea sp.]|nr:TonB-dependent receptor plug domain-containing protein [Luteitalea sp.]
MTRPIALAAWLAFVLCGFAASVHGQGVQTGTLRGTIIDPQSQPVPGATVTLSSPALQGQRTATSDQDGNYVFRALPPGAYRAEFTMPAFASMERTITVPLGGTVEQNVALRLGTVAEQVQVVGDVPAPLATATVGLNIQHEEVEALATSRTLQGIATLSPAVNEATPNVGQIAINGAFAFDNNFMVNGVDVTDNLFGTPQSLFIEDAIEETQVLTSGISAEYGRFSGGVVNAITRSGGNAFSGSYRLNLTNPSWLEETPFEKSRDVVHADTLNNTHEATFGGPIVRDRLWFFSAGRLASLSTAQTLQETGIGITQKDDNKRGEMKLTGSVGPSHTIQGGYLNNSRTISPASGLFDLIADPNSLTQQEYPNWYVFSNYRGVLRNNILADAQFSERRFEFAGGGGTSTSIIDSPFYSPALGVVYNAPYFDATDPEQRNNRQFAASLTSFFDGRGRHEMKGGYEFFRSQNTGGNSQSSTNYVFNVDYLTDASGGPVFDASNRLIPVWVPGETQIENWVAVRGAKLNVNNHSIYVQDHWTVNRHVSADLGFRYERVRSVATGNIIGVDTDTIVPRLALAYDVDGNGRFILHATYGHYAGRYNENQIGANTNVGTPDFLGGTYTGPAGQGRDFAAGLNPSNYDIPQGSFPTANVSIADGLSSPITKEFTLSGGGKAGRAYGELSYVWRRTEDVIEDFVDLSNGVTDVVRNGLDVGTFTNSVYRNSDFGERRYQAAVVQGSYNLGTNLTLSANWTIQLKNEGNYEGEAANQPGVTSLIGDYPEAFNDGRHFPVGRLNSFQRHRARLWAIYNQRAGRFGDFSVSGLLRLESAQAYSLRAEDQPLSDIQKQLLAAYPDAPTSQDLYFGGRGAELFKGYGLLDLSVNYNIPVFRTLRPWLKFDVYNLLNNDKLIAWNTTVFPDPGSSADSLGLATGYRQGPSFGAGSRTRTIRNRASAPACGASASRSASGSDVGGRFDEDATNARSSQGSVHVVALGRFAAQVRETTRPSCPLRPAPAWRRA